MSETPDLRAALERIRDDDPDDSEDRWVTSARLRTIAAAALAASYDTGYECPLIGCDDAFTTDDALWWHMDQVHEQGPA